MEEAKAEWENKIGGSLFFFLFFKFYPAITGFYNMQIMGETL